MDTDQEMMSQNPPPVFDGEQVPVSNQETEKENFWENAFNRGGDGDDDHVKENGNNRSSFTPGETDLNQLPAIPPVSNGQGLPFAPVDFPSPGDVWTWRVGRRVSATGFHKDRFLILPERLKMMKNAPKSFASKNTLSRYLETSFPEIDVNAFFASFSWNIPALFQPPADRVDAASLFEETSKEGENVNEGSNSRYSQRKRKQVQTQTYEPVEVKPKATPRASGRKKKEAATTPATKQKPSSSSRRSTRQKQGDVIDLEEEEEKEAAATKPGKRMKKRRGSSAAEKEEEDVPIPHVYVSPMNGVLAVSHTPVEINPEEFDNYLNTLENLLSSEAGQESSTSASASLPVSASSPVKEYEWAEARMKLSSLLSDKDFSSVLMSDEAAELAALATKLKKDPSLSAEEIVRLKLIEEIPTFSEVFQENKKVIVEADRFFSALELNKSKVASLKYEYSDLKDKLGNIQKEVDTNAEAIRQIDEQIAQLQARRTELTRCINKKEKEKVDLNYGQKMVANSIPNVVKEVQAANSKKPEWEMKKENAVKREEEILNKFASLKGFYL